MPMPVFDKDDNMLMIEVQEVFCIHKEDKTRKIMVTAECGEYYLPSTIDQIGDIMEKFGFLKVDKNNVINVCRIKSIDGSKVTVDGSTYEVSRRKMVILKEMIAKYRPLT